MSKINTIKPHKYSLADIVSSLIGEARLLVPGIQRDFVMGSKTKTINNIISEIRCCINQDKDMDFSTILAHRDIAGNIHIYDGQQRITTLLILLALSDNTMSKISDYFGYTDESRKDSLDLIDELSEGDISIDEPFDTSSYSIMNIVECVKGVDLTGFNDFIINKVKFNVVYKEEVADIEQYFIDLNDGLQLTECQIFKAELTDHILNNLGSNVSTEKWLYSADNEYNYGVSSDARGDGYKVLYFCLLATYNLYEDKKLENISDITSKHLSIAYDMAYRLIRLDDWVPSGNYFEDYVDYGYSIKEQYAEFRNSIDSIPVIEAGKDLVFDYGLLSMVYFNDPRLGKAICNSFLCYSDEFRIHRGKSIGITRAYSMAMLDRGNPTDLTSLEQELYQLMMVTIIKSYLDKGEHTLEDGTVYNRLLRIPTISKVPGIYKSVVRLDSQLRAYYNGKSIIEADRLAYADFGEDVSTVSRITDSEDIINGIRRLELPIVVNDIRLYVPTAASSYWVELGMGDIILPTLRAIYGYRDKSMYSNRAIQIVKAETILMSGMLYRTVFCGDKILTACHSSGNNSLFLTPDKPGNHHVSFLANVDESVEIDRGIKSVIYLGILSHLYYYGNGSLNCNDTNLLRDSSAGVSEKYLKILSSDKFNSYFSLLNPIM